jgi:hypothetical protein
MRGRVKSLLVRVAPCAVALMLPASSACAASAHFKSTPPVTLRIRACP